MQEASKNDDERTCHGGDVGADLSMELATISNDRSLIVLSWRSSLFEISSHSFSISRRKITKMGKKAVVFAAPTVDSFVVPRYEPRAFSPRPHLPALNSR
jgi:hypothetical protein